MSRKRIDMILEIHKAVTEPLYLVLAGLGNGHLNWRPAPDSRSINEIMRHLIRVDNSFLKKLNQEIIIDDPVGGSATIILEALKKLHFQIQILLENCDDDSDLFKKSKYENAEENDTINEHIIHSCQHNLYHLSQMIYLRRALDRSWKSPVSEWDKATRIIAGYLSAEHNN